MNLVVPAFSSHPPLPRTLFPVPELACRIHLPLMVCHISISDHSLSQRVPIRHFIAFWIIASSRTDSLKCLIPVFVGKYQSPFEHPSRKTAVNSLATIYNTNMAETGEIKPGNGWPAKDVS